MSLDIRRHDTVKPSERALLSEALAGFYRNPPSAYYAIADDSTRHYNPNELPFHWDLLAQVHAGTSVLEMGCGTAHLCPRVESRGGTYTGLDYGDTLLAENRRRFPAARFFKIGEPIPGAFDVVASLYTLEHVAEPTTYLKQMWEHCRPEGLLAIICPEFVDSPGLPPSLFYGRTARRLSAKLRRLSLSDAASHLLDLKMRAVAWKRRARKASPGAFWLNLRPRVLHGAEYAIDADAVHLTRRTDIEGYLRQLGAEIIRTSADMEGVSPGIREFNAYVLARKPSRQSH